MSERDDRLRVLLDKAMIAFSTLSPEEQARHRKHQRMSFAYGNLACDGWTSDEFDAWAEGKEW